MGITNACKDVFLFITEFIIQCQPVKIVLKLSCVCVCMKKYLMFMTLVRKKMAPQDLVL